MRTILPSLVIVALATVVGVAGDTTSMTPSAAPDSDTNFKAPDEIRSYATGYEVGAFGGLDIAQDGSYQRQQPHFPNYDEDPHSQLGWMAGIKAGYTWPGWGKGPGFNSDPAEGAVDGRQFTLLPAYETEFFFFNHEQLALDNKPRPGGSTSANLNGYVFTASPILRAQIGLFRPYIGVGPGFAYLERLNAHYITNRGTQGPVYGDQSDGVLALQLEVGSDVFVTQNISLFAEYKLVNFLNPDFSGGQATFKSNQIVNDEFVSMGVRYHF